MSVIWGRRAGSSFIKIIHLPYPAYTGTLEYTGSEQQPVWINYNSDRITIGGTTSATNAGTYTATFTPKNGYCWVDGSTNPYNVEWTINRKVVAVPSQSGTLIYNGKNQSPTWKNYDSSKITIGGTTQALAAGTYTTTFTPKENYCWSNNNTATRSVKWVIYKEALTVPSQSGTLTYNETNQSPTWENYDSTKMTIGGTTQAIDAGRYSATFTPKSEYIWENKSVSEKYVYWNIQKKPTVLSTDSTSLTLSLSTDAKSGKRIRVRTTSGRPASPTYVVVGDSTYIKVSNTSYITGDHELEYTIYPLAVGTTTLLFNCDNNHTATALEVQVTVTA